MYINVLVDIVNEYNNVYNSTIKVKPGNVKSSKYIDFGAKNNDKDPKSEVGNHIWIYEYTSIFAKRHTPNCSGKAFMVKKFQIN